MRRLILLPVLAVLSGCAEPTRFTTANGTTMYYLDCENGLRLFETCAGAARRLCPSGYTQVPLSVSSLANDDRAYSECVRLADEAAEEAEERGAKVKPATCVHTRHKEGFFTCR
jgi:hypothetical protein